MIGIISVTEKGDILAQKLANTLIAKVYLKSKIIGFKLSEVTKEAMKKHSGIIFISSTGIAVRAIAPFLKGKDKDPGVVVVDVSNNYAISLISGHIGGANDLALEVSQILNNIPIITTATDNLGVTAPDVIAVKNSLVIEDLNKAKEIATLLVNGSVVYFKDDKDLIETPNGYKRIEVIKENSVWVTNKIYVENNINGRVDNNKILRLIRKDIVLGIGCRKDIESSRLEDFIKMALGEKNIDIRAVLKIGSIDIKKNEKAIIDLSEKIGCEFNIFSKEDILKVQHKFEGSDFVEKTLGVRAVSEPCVELMKATIIEPKIKFNGMTLCIGQV
ncbi:MAG: cobalt-precorrin 5A hydrolase [Clostridium sp.]